MRPAASGSTLPRPFGPRSPGVAGSRRESRASGDPVVRGAPRVAQVRVHACSGVRVLDSSIPRVDPRWIDSSGIFGIESSIRQASWGDG